MENNKRPETMARITTEALAAQFIDEQVREIRAQVGDKRVLLALSGGVDSSVVAALLIKAVGKQLVCVHVNHGLLRKGEPEQVVEVFRNRMDANLVYVDASERFLSKLAGVSDPEAKRKIIGAEFIRVFEEEARKLSDIEFLAQGTIYPDILESDGVKAHHNVGGLPEDLRFAPRSAIKMSCSPCPAASTAPSSRRCSSRRSASSSSASMSTTVCSARVSRSRLSRFSAKSLARTSSM